LHYWTPAPAHLQMIEVSEDGGRLVTPVVL
jgi:hypothetical protein